MHCIYPHDPAFIDHAAPNCHVQIPILSAIGRGPAGEKGDKGDPGEAFTYDDLTDEQISEIAAQIVVDNSELAEIIDAALDEKMQNPAFTGNVSFDGDIIIQNDEYPDTSDASYRPQSRIGFAKYQVYDSEGYQVFISDSYEDTDGSVGRSFVVSRTIGDETYLNGFYLGIKPDGTKTVYITDPDVWLDAIGGNNASKLTNGTVPVARLPYAGASQDGIITSDNWKKLNQIAIGTDIILTASGKGSDNKYNRLVLTGPGNLRVDESSDGVNWTTAYYAMKSASGTLTSSDVVTALGFTPLSSISKSNVTGALGYTPLKSASLNKTATTVSKTLNVPANGHATYNITVPTPSGGYRPAGIGGITTNHMIATTIDGFNWEATSNTIEVVVRNLTSTAYSTTVTVKLFWDKIDTATS